MQRHAGALFLSPHPRLARRLDDDSRRYDDFREAYWWLRDNTPEDARVMAWWDYGYQIAGVARLQHAVLAPAAARHASRHASRRLGREGAEAAVAPPYFISRAAGQHVCSGHGAGTLTPSARAPCLPQGNRTTLADGNTWNHEHIALLGKCLVSNVTESHKIVRHLADYVLVWTTRYANMWGDDLVRPTATASASPARRHTRAQPAAHRRRDDTQGRSLPRIGTLRR